MLENLKTYKIFQQTTLQSLALLDNQGYCNTHYLLTTPHQKYIIREFGLSHNRKWEFKVQKVASKENIAPQPLLLDREKGLMISEFVEGKHRISLKKKHLIALAKVLKKLHRIKIKTKRKKKMVLCHQDLNPQNILFSSKGIKLIDWEFADFNDKYFDLASVCVEFKLSPKKENIFLKAYLGKKKKRNTQKLDTFKKRYQRLCETWFKDLDASQR